MDEADYSAKQELRKMAGTLGPRHVSIRQELEARKKYHEDQIAKIDTVLSALTPDIEKFQDALRKLD